MFQKLRLFLSIQYFTQFKIHKNSCIVHAMCIYSITIFLKDIQELFARIWEKSLQLSYLYMSLSSGVQCIVRFYVSTLLTRVVLFWHFNTQNLQDKQNFSHALRISCSFWQRLWNLRLSCDDDFLVHLLFKCSDIF